MVGTGIGSLLGFGSGALGATNQNANIKKEKDKKSVFGYGLAGAAVGGLTGAYMGHSVGVSIDELKNMNNAFKNEFNFDPKDYKFNFKWKYKNEKGPFGGGAGARANGPFSGSSSDKASNVGKEFSDKLYSVKTKADATKTFREHAMKHHPDKGGKPEDMRAVNQAWEDFKKFRFDKLAFFRAMRQKAYESELEKIAGK